MIMWIHSEYFTPPATTVKLTSAPKLFISPSSHGQLWPSFARFQNKTDMVILSHLSKSNAKIKTTTIFCYISRTRN